MTNKEFIIQVINALKPTFYNKLTWLIVSAGLAIMGSPFWQAILVAVLRRDFNLDVLPGGNTIWGFLLVLIGLLYHSVTNGLLQYIEFFSSKEHSERARVHDANIYQKSQEVLTERELFKFLSDLSYGHYYFLNDTTKIGCFDDYFSASENQYIDRTLAQAIQRILGEYNKLLEFLIPAFHVYPRNQQEDLRLCMHPEWNMDQEGHGTPEEIRRYKEANDQLNPLIKALEAAYRDYRSLVKSKLFI
jgi:hypothetical protein